jgi:hypothetical protein
LKILKELNLSVIGVVENMKMKASSYVKENVSKMKLPYLNAISFDEDLEEAIGKPSGLASTDFMNDFEKIIEKII